MTTSNAYADAGVDIDTMNRCLRDIRKMTSATRTPGALSSIGAFGGLFASPGKNMLLVASTDGVGTKLKVAALVNRHHTVGADLVNHCVNDILVQGARPLFFMDYLGAGKLHPAVFRDVIRGMCKACRENGCTLLGGETAEMPGLYPRDEYDLVGTIVGAVAKNRLIDGRGIRADDLIIGLPSTGLHTNGYSLARKVLFDQAGLSVSECLPGTRRRVGDILLAVHRSYLHPIMAVMARIRIRGLAHITGGGLLENVPRILPDGLDAVFDTATWTPPAIFRFIAQTGRVESDEMYRVFNMGIGMTVIVRPGDAATTLDQLLRQKCPGKVIGHVTKGSHTVRIVPGR